MQECQAIFDWSAENDALTEDNCDAVKNRSVPREEVQQLPNGPTLGPYERNLV